MAGKQCVQGWGVDWVFILVAEHLCYRLEFLGSIFGTVKAIERRKRKQKHVGGDKEKPT